MERSAQLGDGMIFGVWFVFCLVIAFFGFTGIFILSLMDKNDPLLEDTETKAFADNGKTIEDYFREHSHH